jgi:prepilin-type N-terminal cleavage/methylation domain-containing protein
MRRAMYQKAKPLARFEKQESGFTLLEVIVAIAILTFGILAVASTQVTAIRGNAFASGTTEATTWASDHMENLVALPWDDVNVADTDADGTAGLDDTGGAADQGPVTRGPYTIHWNVADNEVFNNTKTISVIVSWTDHGVPKQITMRRVIPRII